MSLPAAREINAGPGVSPGETVDSKQAPAFPGYPEFYDDAEMMAPNPKRARQSADAPELPLKSALRASRLLDNLGLKLGGSIETTVQPGQATPLDVYMSEEEDASSDADDFSDYGYDSSNEDPTSPTRRSSHEDTARVVSVVYSGKPSIVDLTLLRRRSISPNSIETRTRSSTVSSSRSHTDRPSTPASSVSSPVQAIRKPNLLSDLLVKKRPPFLNIDPYANGSTYSLDLPKQQEKTEDESPVKVPRTPTKLLKNVSRTFSLVRKRSRPFLRNDAPQPQAAQAPASDLSAAPSADSTESGVELTVESMDIPPTPMTPITYGDIVRAAKKNAMMMPPTHTVSPVSPVSPLPMGSTLPKRGILSGLAARRRSIKITGKATG